MKNKIPVILDGDPGHDDAIAWVIANADEYLNILAVTTSSGNQTIEKTTYNAQRICTLINLEVPIGRGKDKPLIRENKPAPNVHGKSGLDGPSLPEPAFPISELSAIDLIAKKVSDSKERVTLVPTGPLTNIALFLLSYPELKNKISQISLMGGGITKGNWTPAAEFNILVDPEAADIVFNSNIPIIMAGLDVTEKALIKPEDFEKIKALNNPVAEVCSDWLEFFYKFHKTMGYEGAPLHDAVAVMALTHSEIFTFQDLYVQVETEGKYTTGATIADIRGTTHNPPNVKVIMDVDREKFVNYLIDSCKFYGEEK